MSDDPKTCSKPTPSRVAEGQLRILALVPARGGSKRVPGKNLKLLGGKPLVAWTIESARQVEEITALVVSTDDDRIAAVAADAGAEVPWLRPAELATDDASTVDVCLHALEWYRRERGDLDGLLLLQPTSPFRTPATIRRGIELFAANRKCAVIGVSSAAAHPWWCFRIADGALLPFCEDADVSIRSQDLPPAVAINGAFYLIDPAVLERGRSFFPDDVLPLVVDSRAESLDIDDDTDWAVAETLHLSRLDAR